MKNAFNKVFAQANVQTSPQKPQTINQVFDQMIQANRENGIDNAEEVNRARDAFNRVFFPLPKNVDEVFNSYIGVNGLQNI